MSNKKKEAKTFFFFRRRIFLQTQAVFKSNKKKTFFLFCSLTRSPDRFKSFQKFWFLSATETEKLDGNTKDYEPILSQDLCNEIANSGETTANEKRKTDNEIIEQAKKKRCVERQE